MSLERVLTEGFRELGLPLSDEAVRRYRIYADFLTEKNAVMNLTAIEGEENIARAHFLDCAALLKLEPMAGRRAIDVGTGAGFPGLALKIACPELQLTLLDSLDKRVGFLRECCEKLGFSDVTCLHARAEEAPGELRGRFDLAFSRAVARLNPLCELCLPFVKSDGCMIAMKGPDAETELHGALQAIRLLGGSWERTETYTVPGTDITHSAVIIRKTGDTPARYPRRWAQIKKQPL